MLKTMSKKEFYYFRQIFEDYCEHLENNFNSLLTKYILKY